MAAMPRYSLRTLMIVVTVVAVCCGLLAMVRPDKRLPVVLFFAYFFAFGWFAMKGGTAKTQQAKLVYNLLAALMVIFIILSATLPAINYLVPSAQ